MLHHFGVLASNFEASRAFYAACLGALGIHPEYEATDVAEFWRRGTETPSLSLERATDIVTQGVHLAFEASDRKCVDAFFDAALAAGGERRMAPRFWPAYRAYCAFVSDPDGNNIEAVHKEVG